MAEDTTKYTLRGTSQAAEKYLLKLLSAGNLVTKYPGKSYVTNSSLTMSRHTQDKVDNWS